MVSGRDTVVSDFQLFNMLLGLFVDEAQPRSHHLYMIEENTRLLMRVIDRAARMLRDIGELVIHLIHRRLPPLSFKKQRTPHWYDRGPPLSTTQYQAGQTCSSPRVKRPNGDPC